MRVLLLSPYSEKLVPTILGTGDEWVSSVDPFTDVAADWIVSFGYRHIIREPHLSQFKRRIVNIHISMLPWNRGADPNFWSWFDGTPKGVSIHYIDAGIDTGDVLAQAEVTFEPGMTLRTSYDILMERAVSLFDAKWLEIRRGTVQPIPIGVGGTCHRSRDKEPWWSMLPNGFDTPVEQIEDMGSEHVVSMAFWVKYDDEIKIMRS